MYVATHNEYPFPAERVWRVIRNFGDMRWLTGVFSRVETAGDGVGMTRCFWRKDNSPPGIHRLEVLDDAQMHLVATVPQSAIFPMTDMTLEQHIEVLDKNRCCVHTAWYGTKPEDVSETELRSVIEAFNKAMGVKLCAWLAAGRDL